jgi:ferredoxin-NADP reductase
MYKPFTIIEKIQHLPDVWFLKLKPQDGPPLFSFLPGQFCLLKNPAFATDDRAHAYSIASSPMEKDYLEFCIKVYGKWSAETVQLNLGDTLLVGGPFGAFTWKDDPYSVFLVGGIGITPVMSMLRNLKDSKKEASIVLLYGCRTPDTIAFKDELSLIEKENKKLKIVHIFSHLDQSKPFEGYQGFINEDVIKKEADLSKNPRFYVVGPPDFITSIVLLLSSMSVGKDRITTENFA